MKFKLIFVLFLFFIFSAQSQSIKEESINLPMFRFNYSFQVPYGIMAERFGNNSSIGISFMVKTRSNFFYGYQHDIIFGNQIVEDGILDSISTYDGQIINQLGGYADYIINQRGFYSGPQIGYLYSFKKPNPNSGIFFMLSGGILQHKINFQIKNEDSPQIMGEYLKGYDRLTNGFALKESIGYMFFDNKSVINFYAAIEFYQGWTESKREIDYDLMVKDTRDRLDLLVGYKLGWIITIQKRTSDNYFYN